MGRSRNAKLLPFPFVCLATPSCLQGRLSAPRVSSARAVDLGVVPEPHFSLAVSCLAFVAAREALGVAALPTEAFRFEGKGPKDPSEQSDSAEATRQFVGIPRENWEAAEWPEALRGLELGEQVRKRL